MDDETAAMITDQAAFIELQRDTLRAVHGEFLSLLSALGQAVEVLQVAGAESAADDLAAQRHASIGRLHAALVPPADDRLH